MSEETRRCKKIQDGGLDGQSISLDRLNCINKKRMGFVNNMGKEEAALWDFF